MSWNLGVYGDDLTLGRPGSKCSLEGFPQHRAWGKDVAVERRARHEKICG